MATADDVLRLAATTVGEVESPPNTNRTRFCDWYGLTGPWCAMWVSWVFHQAGLPLPASTSKGFAYTPAGAAWFQQQKRWTTKPARGHVVFFDFPGDGVNRISHVGIVDSVRADGAVVTLEANTSPGNGGSQRDGGGVYRRVRSSGIVGYGIPAYTSAAPAAEEEDEMKPYLVVTKAGHVYVVHPDAIIYVAHPDTLSWMARRWGPIESIDDTTFQHYKTALNFDEPPRKDFVVDPAEVRGDPA